MKTFTNVNEEQAAKVEGFRCNCLMTAVDPETLARGPLYEYLA